VSSIKVQKENGNFILVVVVVVVVVVSNILACKNQTSTFELNIIYEQRLALKMYSHRFHRIVDFSL
jgi:hypothetical protein